MLNLAIIKDATMDVERGARASGYDSANDDEGMLDCLTKQKDLSTSTYNKALHSMAAAAVGKKTSQSIAQLKYREQQKQRVTTLERQVELLLRRVQELERSGADAAVIVQNPKTEVETTSKRFTELETSALEAIANMREAFWSESEEELMGRLQDFMPVIKRFRLANERGFRLNNILVVGAPLEHWESVVKKLNPNMEVLLRVRKWHVQVSAKLAEFQRRRSAALGSLLLAQTKLEPSAYLGALNEVENLPNEAHSRQYHIKWEVQTELATQVLNDGMSEQERYTDSAFVEFIKDVLKPRLAIEYVLLSLPHVIDPFGISRALMLHLAEMETQMRESADDFFRNPQPSATSSDDLDDDDGQDDEGECLDDGQDFVPM